MPYLVARPLFHGNSLQSYFSFIVAACVGFDKARGRVRSANDSTEHVDHAIRAARSDNTLAGVKAAAEGTLVPF